MGSYMKNAASGGGGNVDSTPKREKSDSGDDESPLKRVLKKIRGNDTPSPSDSPYLHSYHRGGKVRKSGPANLKKGETVLTKSQMREMKRKKGRGKKRGGKKR